MNKEQTLGEKRVRTDFNVSGNGIIDVIKKDTAKLIDTVESLKLLGDGNTTPEKFRLIALAQTAYEEACHWAVKAATA